MSNGKYYGVAIFYIVNIDKFNSVKTLCFVSISFRVGYYRGYSVLSKLIVYIDDFRISRVGAIFFKRKAENRNLCVFYRDIRLYKILTVFSATYLPISSFMRLPERIIWL